MKTETIEKILNFLKEKEDKEIPKKWLDFLAKNEKMKELIRVLENHPDGTQYKHNDNLDLRKKNIKKLPNDLYVGGVLNLLYSKISELPDKLYVKGSLYLSGCKQITKLPNTLFVVGDLILDGTNITELPNNLYVGYNLNLNETNIEKLPNNLYVGSNLWLRNTPLADKYTDEEIYEIVASTGGKINDIIRL